MRAALLRRLHTIAAAGGRGGAGSRVRLALIAACTSGLLVHAASDAQAADARKPATHTIVIDGTKYAPETLTVNVGDSIVWVNKDPFPHTATAKGSFDSHSIAAGKSWTWTPRKAGEYGYVCTLHPNMTGTVKVE